MNRNTIVIIPARMGSSRFPGKVMSPVLGKPLLHWVIRNAVEAVGKAQTFVASCDTEILSFAELEEVGAIRTLDTHERATDRTSEAVGALMLDGHRIEYVLMLQGDEPTICSSDIRRAIDATESSRSGEIVNLMGKIPSVDEWVNPNTIKVVVNDQSEAMYFSRSPVPYGHDSGWESALKQVCAIGFPVSSLNDFSAMKPHSLEVIESIDMLRWLANGKVVRMVPIESRTHPVDVPSDVPIVEELLKNARDI